MIVLVNRDCRASRATARVAPTYGFARPTEYGRGRACPSPESRPTMALSQHDNILYMLQRCCCNWAHVVGSLFEDGIQRGQIAQQFLVARLNGRQRFHQPLGEGSFEVAIALASELGLDLLL